MQLEADRVIEQGLTSIRPGSQEAPSRLDRHRSVLPKASAGRRRSTRSVPYRGCRPSAPSGSPLCALLTIVSPSPAYPPKARCTSRSPVAVIRWRGRHHRRNDQPAAGAVAGDRDTARFEIASKEVAIAGEGVLDHRREWVLGRKPVIKRQRPASGGAANFSNQVPVGLYRVSRSRIRHHGDIKARHRCYPAELTSIRRARRSRSPALP